MLIAKWSIGIFIFFGVLWLSAPMIFGAMKKKDFDSLYYNMQDAKRRVGAYVEEDDTPNFSSYEEKYVRGEL